MYPTQSPSVYWFNATASASMGSILVAMIGVWNSSCELFNEFNQTHAIGTPAP